MTPNIVEIFYQIIVFLFAISVHESAHAWTASRCGDPTARMLGRVSLNPIRHIDLIGTVVLPLVAALSGMPLLGWAKPLSSPAGHELITEVGRGFGGASGNSAFAPVAVLLYELMLINIVLAVFNLIPVPPLDGSHVLRHFLPDPMRMVYDRVGIFGLIALVYLGGGLLGSLIRPFVRFYLSVLEKF